MKRIDEQQDGTRPSPQRSTVRRRKKDWGHGRPNPHFEHLYRVCREAVRRGDTRLAETLLISYRDEARRLQGSLRLQGGDRQGCRRPLAERRDGAQRHRLIQEAENKAVRRLANLLSRSMSEPAPCQRRSKSTPLAGVKMHHLMRFSPALAVVPAVHRRDPRCFV